MFNSIFETTGTGTTSISFWALTAAVGSALGLGIITSLVHRRTEKLSGQFSTILVILPLVITIIIMLVDNSIARAFSLAGVFTIIRFRSAPMPSKGLAYVLISLAIGLACGTGYVFFALVSCVIMCLAMTVIELTKYGKPSCNKSLSILIPEDVDFEKALTDTLKKYTSSYTLQKIKTEALGSLFKLQYLISMKKDASEKEFIDELRCHNENLTINLSIYNDTED